MTVTWGTNQVFTYGNASPAGSTAPAPSTGFSSGGLFGSSPAPAPSGGLFGSSPAPAPSTSLFGSAPAPSGGIFGSSTPAPASGGGLFGSSPAPAPSAGLFGSSPTPASGGLFGSTPAPSTSLFGAPSPAQQALEAHMNASARQQAAKLQAALEKYYIAYTGAPTEDKDKFVTIVYDDISPEQRQLQWLMRGQRVPPPKPPTVSEKEWLEAVVRNPEPESYMPVALNGAAGLQTRVAWQQDRANSFAKNLHVIEAARATLQQRCDRMETDLQTLTRIHTILRTRLLEVMRKVELVRCMNLPLQQDEVTLKRRLVEILKQVDQVSKLLVAAQTKAKGQSQVQSMPIVNIPDERELSRVLKGHRETLTNMTKTMDKDKRDLVLLRHHVVPKVPLPPH